MTHPNGSKPVLIGEYQTKLGNQTISYSVKRSPKSKHVRFVIRQHREFTVTVPSNYKIEDLPKLLQAKSRWILSKLAVSDTLIVPPVRQELRHGDRISYLGRKLKIVERQIDRSIIRAQLDKNRLLIERNPKIIRLETVVEWWYRERAEVSIRKRVDELLPLFGVTYNRITVRQAKTRWGSCSKKKNLNFNWKLMMVPEAVMDYVIIHELAHLIELNHSKRFWDLVAKHCPKYRKHIQWLKDHNAELSGYGVAPPV